MKSKILCGLDIGTNSVGWCLMDENNNVIKKQGKSLWGVRLFDEAKTASERRTYRSSRRRIRRRRERINLLQGLFAKEMQNYDKSFFYRLNNSFYHNEDRETQFDYTLFNDRNFSDKEFYSLYKTIYHLRYHLINSENKEDLRFIYLALHHMIKYRGNFLQDGVEFKISDKKIFNDDLEKLKRLLEERNIILNYNQDIFEDIQKANKEAYGVNSLQERLDNILNLNKDKFLKNVVLALIAGKSVEVKKMDIADFDSSECDVKSLCFKNENCDADIEKILSSFSSEENLIEIISTCKSIFQFLLLDKLMGDSIYLSEAMIKKYNEYKKDLNSLKKYIKKNKPNQYSRIFRHPRKIEITKENGRKEEKEETNYSSYVGSYAINNEVRRFKHGEQSEFYKLLKEVLELNNYKKAEDIQDEYLKEVFEKIENKTYLAFLNSTDNSVFPYQLNLLEMEVILQKQSKYYPFLLERDEDGTIIDKIESLLTFKIPYYVGPLANKNPYNHVWAIKKEGKIYPWNFDKMINKEDTASEFIRRMVGKCTYLSSEYCLPKNSLMFSYYEVLSFVNKIFVNGSYLRKEDKLELINELFMKKRKVSTKDIKNFFKAKTGQDVEITTTQGKTIEQVNCSLASYYDFVQIFKEQKFVEENKSLIESIIVDIVVFEDKYILEERLKKKYGITDSKILKSIKALNYSKYGRLSKMLLSGIKAVDESSGEVYGSIIHLMETTNENLQEILNNERYNFKKLIDEYNKEHSLFENIQTIEDFVDTLYVSPGMRRGLIQAYKIVDELEKIVKKPIDEFYVECTRTNKVEKKVPKTRKEKILLLYEEANNVLKDDEQFKKMYDRLQVIDNSQFQSDKYYLYFLQFGRCIYSREPIELQSLYDTKSYDIDHIIPRALIKDDSINNKVLVKQDYNKNKSDTYPIPHSLFNGHYDETIKFWKMLKDKNLMSEEKYARLVRRELSDEDLSHFINRQLVFTNQAVTGFIQAIRYFKKNNPKIIYSKSENISDFRKQFELVKSREANNFHHAHDAYLNVFVGRAIDSYFSYYKSLNYGYRDMRARNKTTNPIKIFDTEHPIEVMDSDKNLVWKVSYIDKIRHQLYKCYDILSTTRTYCDTSLFRKVTINAANSKDANIGIKSDGPLSNVKKYGGLKEYSYSFYSLIKVNGKYILESIPLAFASNIKEYLMKFYKKFEIVVDKLKTNTVIKCDGRKFCITGKSGNSLYIKNLNERRFSYEELQLIHKIEVAMKKIRNAKLNIKNIVTDEQLKIIGFYYLEKKQLVIAPKANDETKAIIVTNEECGKFLDSFLKLISKDVYNYSQSNSINARISQNRQIFDKLAIVDKIRFLYNLLAYLKCNTREAVDMSLFNGKKQSGILKFSKKIPNCKIISESITGFYQKTLWVNE